MLDLAVIWGLIIAFGLIVYIILDGFDIGVGVLMPFVKNNEDRKILFNSIAPFWDGNETWLVLGGVSLMAAFPIAYATVLTALYIPIVIYISAVIFRGVSFEFRFKSGGDKNNIWDWVFGISSIIMAFGQGLVIGSFIEGFEIENQLYVGGQFDWLDSFSVMAGIAMVFGHALLGATWLIIKTEGLLQERMRRLSFRTSFIVVILMGIVAIWTPKFSPEIGEMWQNNLSIIIAIFITFALFYLYLLKTIKSKQEYTPFFTSIAMYVVGYIGLVISIWPYVIPRKVDIWQASSAVKTQNLSLIAVLLLLPFVFYYTYHSYKVFAGKVKKGERLY